MSSTPLLPTFSIILETENLANADMAGLHCALQSLASQDLPPTAANEVLLLETGDAPQAYLAQLAEAYPWLTFCAVPKALGYYEVKMWAAEKATGEVIVYCDSDCCYERSWLQRMVMSFTANEQIQVLAGETAIRECIWRQPQARASHAPPNGLWHFYWRFLLIGHDDYWQQRLLGKPSQRPRVQDHQGWRGKLKIFGQRLRRMVRHDPKHILFLPSSPTIC
ncbi:glycosyltransferase family A protein [Thermosynechococcus sp. QKsg1]|uniref:glycosyltransferase family A protein n=1 Tax=Thermosynechococcus sp. QKsg1 TaxID=3074130 RepID=UPI002877E7DA|nr:glycosyltransferase family A protein [Thermosynechococcus sp. QKsg1]WNC87768.1 glycosyltransferase family A protein [Thermosynechococcus sp. QKsg1]